MESPEPGLPAPGWRSPSPLVGFAVQPAPFDQRPASRVVDSGVLLAFFGGKLASPLAYSVELLAAFGRAVSPSAGSEVRFAAPKFAPDRHV